MSYGILFSGQGAQKAGMGLDFLDDDLFKETIEKASLASQEDLVAILRDENGELDKTINVQPALVAFEIGIFRMLKRDCPHLNISGMVGLSLGEYSAMYASGSLDLENTLSLVSDRARYMQEDADQIENGMAAILKPKFNDIEVLVQGLQKQNKRVYIANYNSPKQVVIAGEKCSVALASKQIKDQDLAKRIIMLKVNGAFHTPLFNNAKTKMTKRLANMKFQESKTPVISNTTALPFSGNWREIMAKQLTVPTHFGSCIQYLVEHEQIDQTLEIGPGKVLSSFARQVDRHLKCSHIGNYAEYQTFVEEEHGIKE